ncbi:unnamed protein product [Euphydryas editha]|uniref:Uncharacterized protein n=1 Tax=Euphydryas editha TaxID=104508 RepID=A0AAU9UBQ5_EUPED|nr:unnamed protein product [Euphydryas editha]
MESLNSKPNEKQSNKLEMTTNSISVDSDVNVQSHDPAGSINAGKMRQKPHKRPRPKFFSPPSGNERGMFTRARKRSLARRRAYLLVAEEEITEKTCASEHSRKALGLDVEDSCSANALNKQALQDVDLILKVAHRSTNLKGTLVSVFKEAVGSIKAVVEALHTRTVANEVAKLQELEQPPRQTRCDPPV